MPGAAHPPVGYVVDTDKEKGQQVQVCIGPSWPRDRGVPVEPHTVHVPAWAGTKGHFVARQTRPLTVPALRIHLPMDQQVQVGMRSNLAE